MEKKTNVSLFLLIVCFLMVAIVGCSKSDKVEKKEKSIDTSFINDLGTALEKRWKYLEDVDSGKIEVKDDVEYYEKLISYEKSLYQYADKDFNDPKLKALAKDYINGLKNQEESIKYYNVDEIKYDELWSKGYDERSIALLALVEDYGVELDDKQFKDLKTNAQLVKEQNDVKAKVEEIVRNITFNNVGTEYDWTKYNTTVENTAGVDLEGFGLDINFLDANGVVIGTANVYHDTLWKAGQKILLEFETDVTGFEKMEWDADYYIAESE